MQMYDFLIRELRHMDQAEGRAFLERYFRGPQYAWERTIARIQALPELADVTRVEADFLRYLKNIVGWTDVGVYKRITDAIDDDALRRLIAVSGALWRERGTESAMLNVLQLLTVQRCRIWNWFDFRWVLGETGLSEEREGVDPWVVMAPGEILDAGPPAVYSSDENTSNLRIVDDGTLDRTLVKRIVRLMRPLGERYEITYLSFLDLFLVPSDETQWDHPAGLELVVADGRMQLTDATAAQSTHAIVPGADAWEQYAFTARLRGRSDASGGWFGVTFYRTDASNYYELVVDTVAQELRLRKRVAGVLSTIATVNLGLALVNILADVWYALRVSIVPEGGSTNRIVAFVDGIELVNTTDASHTAGAVGVRHEANAVLEVDEVEVIPLPIEPETLEINDNP
jgi:hypothetical protein